MALTTGICHLCSKPGQCCTYVELPLQQYEHGRAVTSYVKAGGYYEFALARELSEDEQRWVNLHPGIRADARSTWFPEDYPVELKLSDAGLAVRIESKCKALQPDGGCGLYGSDERPTMCSVWPDDPANQAPEGCAYLVQATEEALSPS